MKRRCGERRRILSIIDLYGSATSLAAEVARKPYLVGYVTPQLEKFDDRRRNTREHVVRLSSMGGYAHDADLSLREFS